jgi:anti-anti-sigma regulatory factor
MGELILEGAEGSRKVIAVGKLTIQDASRLKDLLMEAYAGEGELCIDLTGTESLDLACMQVLCSAHKSFGKAKRAVHMTGELSEGVRRSLQEIAIEAGSCGLESSAPCLWVAGGRDE